MSEGVLGHFKAVNHPRMNRPNCLASRKTSKKKTYPQCSQVRRPGAVAVLKQTFLDPFRSPVIVKTQK